MTKAVSARKNVLLNNGQRYEMYKHYKKSFESSSTKNLEESNTEQDQKQNDPVSKKDGMTYGELINWAVDRYKLEKRPNKSTISKMISRMDEERALGGPERKRGASRIQKGRFPTNMYRKWRKLCWNGWMLMKANVYRLHGP
ncbi:hypothetical protein BDB00DRAFT_578987 [Zychaea mexicana]|uniref:uncharacterized protein n=1 Tax=Zychaea mexicana TaxID=64656 RepID=UPI0022FEA42C|nr:uncharacterized protein BDB00DRAFT_578987 [Zychaea mexicana]KAI9489906.1 hypothetical protein BDB00DRAFT_578987 [Zychaea mexicana]